MDFRQIKKEDVRAFYDCMKAIDQETEYMLYEPDERVWNQDLLEGKIEREQDFLVGAFEEKDIVGFLSAERGTARRIQHSAYIVVGIQKAYCHRGIGSQFFAMLDDWARTNHITRLELTVRCDNEPAIHLYRKNGFVVEGVKKHTMRVNGEYVDEYTMAKLY